MAIAENTTFCFGRLRTCGISRIKASWQVHSHAGAFSFYATKNLVTGEGGIITTNDASLPKIRVYSLHGMSRNAWNRYATKNSWFYEILCPGYKYNMTDIQAALGMTQLSKLDRMQKRREDIIAKYNEEFGAMPELEIPADREYMVHGWHCNYQLNLDRRSIDRNRFIEMVSEENIGTSVSTTRTHASLLCGNICYNPDDYPEAYKAYQRIYLCAYPKMSDGM